jgi:NAD(P)-dependent dehydrogenase (short-subunit alcohol dehydrogenase family)
MIQDIFSMDGKVCMVTGGSSGLGSYMAQGFLEAGAARVYITARSADKLKVKAEELSGLAAGECIALPGDLETMDGVEALSKEIHDLEGHLDVLVNNAGIGTGGMFDTISYEEWDVTMNLNLKSPFFLTKALHDLLKVNATVADPARVLFTSSICASEVFAHVLAYSTSKNAIEHLTAQLALRLCDEHIHVNTIAPGRFISEMTRGAWQDPDKESYKAELERIPAHRYGGLEDMAGVAVMLCSQAGSYFTGEVLNLDGGHRLRH